MEHIGSVGKKGDHSVWSTEGSVGKKGDYSVWST